MKMLTIQNKKRTSSQMKSIAFHRSMVLFFSLIFISGISSVQAQYYKEAMRGLNKVNVRMIKLSADATKNKLSSYLFTGKLERELASLGARLTEEKEAEAYAVIDIELSDPMGIAYGYQVRIRFMRLIPNDKKSKTMKKIPVTIWETSRLGYSSKIDLRNNVEDTYKLVLDEFAADFSEANN
jgi:hypothetical protein